MKMTLPKAGYFTFWLEREDWLLDGKGFLREIKERIPSQCREYNDEHNIWTIAEVFYSTVRQMRQEWFVPPNHDLFEEGLE